PDQPQLVPQRLDRLAPFMEVRGVAVGTGAGQRFASLAMCGLETRRQRAEVAMLGSPFSGVAANLLERDGGLLQGLVACGRALHGRFLRGQLSANPRERLLAEELRRLALER